MPAVVTALKMVPELIVEVVTSSCCGMAGSFGYRPEHFDVSLRMAETALLPAVRRRASAASGLPYVRTNSTAISLRATV